MQGNQPARLIGKCRFAGLLTVTKDMVDSGGGRGDYLCRLRQSLGPGSQLPAGHRTGPVAKQIHPAMDGTDPGDEFPHVRRLGNKVVGAEIPANYLVRLVQHAGQHYDAAVPWRAEHGNQ